MKPSRNKIFFNFYNNEGVITLSIMMPQRTVLLVLAPIPLALVLSPLGAAPGVMWPYIRVLCCTVPYCTLKMGACDPSHVMRRAHHAALTCRHMLSARHAIQGQMIQTSAVWNIKLCNLQWGICIISSSNALWYLIWTLNMIKHVIDMSILILGS